MSVLVEAISVVIRIATLEEKYPGGLAGYRSDCPNRTFCADDHLCRVGFMVPTDVGYFVDTLERLGLKPFQGDMAHDVVVIDQTHGPTTDCDWIEGGWHPDGYTMAWLAGTEPGPLMVLDGWTEGQSLRMKLIPTEEQQDRLLELGMDQGMTVALDLKTGREIFIAKNWPEYDPDENATEG